MTGTTAGALAASVHSRNAVKYAVETAVRHHRLHADEPAAAGGGDAAPTPMEALAAALAGCTAITLRMYAERKGWELGEVRVDVRAIKAEGGYRFERALHATAPLDAAQWAKLAEIAEKTPVTKVVKAGAAVATTVG